MSPFQQFRFWIRRAPASERAIAGVAMLAALALLAWSLTAATGDSSPSSDVAAGASASAPGAGQSTSTTIDAAGGAGNGSAPAISGSTRSGTTGAAATTSGSTGGCVAPPSNAPGVSATEIKIAVSLTNIIGPAADETFGGDPPDTLREDYDAVIGDINAHGGVACRKLVPTYYEANPANQDELQQKCLDMVESGVFAVLDQGSFADYSPISCFAQHHTPYFGSYIVSQAMLDAGYPYLFDFQSYDSLYKNAVFALRDHGFFNPANGFKKLGFVYRDCYAKVIADIKDWLHQAGVPDSAIVPYSVGCPSVFASPSDVEQAVLKFKSEGVTNVTIAEFVGDFPNFTNFAEQQGFRPKYGFGDDSVISAGYGSFHPNFDNIDGAIAVVGSRIGEEKTAGSVPSAGTVKCNAVYAAKGKPPVYQRRLGGGGRICNNVGYFVAAVEHAPALTQEALAAGLQRAKSIDFSFPEGPTDFSGNRVTHGGQFWRYDQFDKGCSCWKVIEPNFRPSF